MMAFKRASPLGVLARSTEGGIEISSDREDELSIALIAIKNHLNTLFFFAPALKVISSLFSKGCRHERTSTDSSE